MESGDVSFDYYKTILYNDDLKGLDGDGSDGDEDETDHSVPDQRGQPVSERADRQASLHLLQKMIDHCWCMWINHVGNDTDQLLLTCPLLDEVNNRASSRGNHVIMGGGIMVMYLSVCCTSMAGT